MRAEAVVLERVFTNLTEIINEKLTAITLFRVIRGHRFLVPIESSYTISY